MSYSDGNYSSPYLTGLSIGYPLNAPNNGGTREYALTYIQWANTYTDATIGAIDNNAPSAYLVEQGPVQRIGAGCVQFTRTFCEVPETWSETQETSYTYPGLSGGSGALGTWDAYAVRSPITLSQLGTITHSYAYASPPTRDATFTVTASGNVVDYVGPLAAGGFTSPSVEPATYTIASDVRLWRGNIWEKVTTTVPKPA